MVPLQSEKGIMDAVTNDLVPNINKMVPHIDSLINNLNDLVSDPALIASVRRLDGITENVLTMTGDLQGTVKRDVPPLMRNARNLTYKLDSVSYNLMLLSHNLNQLPINSTMDNVYKITDELSRFSQQLNEENSTLGLLTKDPELYNRLNRVAADIDSLVLDVKKNPKRYISIKLF